MSENYKRLLPAPMPPGSQAKAPESTFQKETGPPVKKRTVSKAACNNCRLKKIRCDGKRPACTACSKAGVECNFVTASSDETPFMALKREVESLRRSTEDMLEIFDLLESAPDAVSLDILRRLKSTRNLAEGASDTSDILASVKKDLEDDPLLPVKLSNRQLMAGLIPETQQTPEYELMMRCPTAYPMLIPVEIAFINLADLLRPAILEPPRAPSFTGQGDMPSSSSVPAGPSEGGIRSGVTPTVLDASDHEIGNFEPLQSMHTIVDDRLKSVNFQSWTTVPITNELAANLISLYLEIDHPWCPLFDADLFLNDCIQGKTHFCSTLLMNALLGWTCQSYSSLQPEAAAYSIAFESEAERLWQVEKFTNTLTAAAAAQFLNSTSASRGRDDFANQCLEEGIQMGKRMGLFGVGSENASALTWLDHHQDWLRAASHTSWGIFSCACIRSLHLHRAEIETPPLLPMPGQYFETHGYTNYTYPHQRTLVSAQVSEAFKAMCKFNLIVHEIIWAYFGTSNTVPAARATVEFAEQMYRRMFEWAASLPLGLSRGRRNRHSNLMLHLYYHCTVMELLWPFLQQSANKELKMKHLTTTAAIKDIHESSVNQLKRLALIYCINFSNACSSTLWHIALLYLSNAMLCETMRSGKLRNPECWFYFMLCMTGYENIIDGSFQVAEVTMLGLLSMALRNGFLSAPEANTILNDMRKIGQRYDSQFTVRASFMVDLELAMTNPREAQVQTLASAFHELAIFREFTTGELR
ncbi:hypothetical protein F4813DRAFT_382260 [Daldinia decipiens]|uniref:uncharacterized protein n=1 Tax=Daldinia decipiens TaxID=326647 RepID=UPI0020C2B1CF|nr:uncharacterized protein F4813DRAFT_382260 [Daldinia decipiens]KAI1655065.1 hypothetical protein F4813DRAFT_382260 [Daldinia decipiens]